MQLSRCANALEPRSRRSRWKFGRPGVAQGAELAHVADALRELGAGLRDYGLDGAARRGRTRTGRGGPDETAASRESDEPRDELQISAASPALQGRSGGRHDAALRRRGPGADDAAGAGAMPDWTPLGSRAGAWRSSAGPPARARRRRTRTVPRSRSPCASCAPCAASASWVSSTCRATRRAPRQGRCRRRPRSRGRGPRRRRLAPTRRARRARDDDLSRAGRFGGPPHRGVLQLLLVVLRERESGPLRHGLGRAPGEPTSSPASHAARSAGPTRTKIRTLSCVVMGAPVGLDPQLLEGVEEAVAEQVEVGQRAAIGVEADAHRAVVGGETDAQRLPGGERDDRHPASMSAPRRRAAAGPRHVDDDEVEDPPRDGAAEAGADGAASVGRSRRARRSTRRRRPDRGGPDAASGRRCARGAPADSAPRPAVSTTAACTPLTRPTACPPSATLIGTRAHGAARVHRRPPRPASHAASAPATTASTTSLTLMSSRSTPAGVGIASRTARKSARSACTSRTRRGAPVTTLRAGRRREAAVRSRVPASPPAACPTYGDLGHVTEAAPRGGAAGSSPPRRASGR